MNGDWEMTARGSIPELRTNKPPPEGGSLTENAAPNRNAKAWCVPTVTSAPGSKLLSLVQPASAGFHLT